MITTINRTRLKTWINSLELMPTSNGMFRGITWKFVGSRMGMGNSIINKYEVYRKGKVEIWRIPYYGIISREEVIEQFIDQLYIPYIEPYR